MIIKRTLHRCLRGANQGVSVVLHRLTNNDDVLLPPAPRTAFTTNSSSSSSSSSSSTTTTTTTTTSGCRRFYHSTRISSLNATAATAAPANTPAPSQSTGKSVVSKPSWKDIFPPAQFVSVWETPRRDDYFGSCRHHPTSNPTTKDEESIDTASRHVIATLQRLYRTGFVPHAQSVVTREWCHYVLQQLGSVDGTSANHSSTATNKKNNSNSINSSSNNNQMIPLARMKRIRALLTSMQLMDRMDIRSAPFEVPSPNGKTYRLVLDMYTRADIAGTDVTPEQSLSTAYDVLDLVVRMEQSYRTVAELQMKPTVVEWNRVLQVYAQTKHPHRAHHAVHDVLFPHMLNPESLVVDGSSLWCILRACGFQVPSEEAAVRGAHVAALVWERLMQDHVVYERVMPLLRSHFYSLLLQCVRHLPPSRQREQIFEEAFAQASKAGKLNAVIVQEFLANAKPHFLVERVLGAERLAKVVNLKPKESAQILLRNMPPEWSANKD